MSDLNNPVNTSSVQPGVNSTSEAQAEPVVSTDAWGEPLYGAAAAFHRSLAEKRAGPADGDQAQAETQGALATQAAVPVQAADASADRPNDTGQPAAMAALLNVVAKLAERVEAIGRPPAPADHPPPRPDAWNPRAALERDLRQTYGDALPDAEIQRIIDDHLGAEYLEQWGDKDGVDPRALADAKSRASLGRRELQLYRAMADRVARLEHDLSESRMEPQKARAWDDVRDLAERVLSDTEWHRSAGESYPGLFGRGVARDVADLAVGAARRRANGASPEKFTELVRDEMLRLERELPVYADLVRQAPDRAAAVSALARVHPDEAFARALTGLLGEGAPAAPPSSPPANGSGPTRPRAPGPPAPPARSNGDDIAAVRLAASGRSLLEIAEDARALLRQHRQP